MRETVTDFLWVLGLDSACAVDLYAGAAQHPALMALVLALFNFAAGYGLAAARAGTTEGE